MYDRMKYRLKILNILISFGDNHKVYFYLGFVFKIFIALLAFATPLLYREFIEEVIINANFNLMLWIALGYLAVYLLSSLFTYLSVYCSDKLINFVTLQVKGKILKNYFNREFSEYEHIDSGYMKTRMEDDTLCIEKYFTVQSIDYIISMATLIITAVILMFIEWRLALFAIISIPLTLAIDHAIAKKEATVLKANRQNSQNMAQWLHSSMQGWREIKTLNLQRREERIFTKFTHIYALTYGIWINYWTFRHLVAPKIKNEFLMKFALYFFGGIMIIRGQLGIAALLVFMQYYALFAANMQKVSETDAELVSGTPQSDRLLEEAEMELSSSEIAGEPLEGYDIQFENVSFSYGNDSANIIDNISFKIGEGEKIAIKGKSGAGKTTILKLMTGMLRPNSGLVLFGGKNLNLTELKKAHEKIGFIMQENILFNDTIAENLLYGNENASTNDMSSACKKAHILDFIESLPDKFETVIGERGIKLSGGQKQRLVLARQFLRNPDIYIFDEATSALDQYSENIIQKAIANIGEHKSIIIVSHRESSVSICDRVITL